MDLRNTYRLSTACMEMNRAGTLKVSKNTSAAFSRFLLGLSGASVRRTGCYKKEQSCGDVPKKRAGLLKDISREQSAVNMGNGCCLSCCPRGPTSQLSKTLDSEVASPT